MLDSLKSTLRLFKNKWMKLKHDTRLLIIAVLIGFMLAGNSIIAGYLPVLKEENFSAMQNLVYTMVENQSTDVDFDTSKIDKYEVIHRRNNGYEIVIYSNGFEKMVVTLTENYKIQTLQRNDAASLLFFRILFFALFLTLGYVLTHVLYAIYRFLRKFVLFFEE